ncbi:hypothetical protein [Sphaerochaeta sp.]|uniref:hypothetical protein n=1 Tax=Sphaerochaeta sp. TaxID=1972642 RepID=UPI0025892AA7|nr:hypothetical protein [Sphaerochaeta sp.]MDD3457291.1 hypothetical protein [Sphaerochaeta sp.]
MKKMFVLVLLVPILTIALISCDPGIRSNIAGFMGNLGGNVYIDNEWVQPNTADAEAAVATITTLGTAGSTTTATASSNATMFGISGVDLIGSGLSGDTTILAPQSVDDQNALKNSVASALTSPTQTATLIAELGQPATAEQKTAAAGTTAVFNAVITSLATQVTEDDNPTLGTAIAELSLPSFTADDDITQGDLLILQMMTNLVNNTITQLSDGSGGIDASTVDSDTALAILGDALFTAQVAEQLSGASTINFSGDLITGLTGLMNGSRSRRNTE